MPFSYSITAHPKVRQTPCTETILRPQPEQTRKTRPRRIQSSEITQVTPAIASAHSRSSYSAHNRIPSKPAQLPHCRSSTKVDHPPRTTGQVRQDLTHTPLNTRHRLLGLAPLARHNTRSDMQPDNGRPSETSPNRSHTRPETHQNLIHPDKDHAPPERQRPRRHPHHSQNQTVHKNTRMRRSSRLLCDTVLAAGRTPSRSTQASKHQDRAKPRHLAERIILDEDHLVETIGIEPTTPCLQSRCSPS
jgi:hypothetical protein